MPRLNSITFYQSIPELKLFLQRNAKFSSAGLRPHSSVHPAAGGFKLAPPL